ncbi:PorT family protein (plasmid) [Hymenobacter sp. BRD128]|uniref:porin family protein n=1 Tax=Hymenobacter sp. BRD128 TaxID=2675878 RepID=UPI0015660B76|nr:porin family protein [Hymenobacter sp. BRD128]QKG59253.1 PorT family protein [Hymenobacter sp. BRD128]
MNILHSLSAASLCNLFTFSAYAQSGPQFGLQLGLNNGAVRYVTEANHYGSLSTGYQTGLAAGLTSNLPFGNHWSLSTGLRYLRTGFTTNEIVPSTDPGSHNSTQYKSAYALNRVELPVDVLYFFSQSQKGFFLTGGVSVGVLLSGKRTVDILDTDGVRTVEYSVSDEIKVAKDYPLGTTAYYLQRWDAGIKGGLGYKYRSIAVQAFYRFGIADIAANSALNSPSPTINSRLTEIQVAYLFGK